MGRGDWLREGVDPLPPDRGDKQVDREALDAAGGVALITGKRVLDIGPCYGAEARGFSGLAGCYVVVDYDALVIEWVAKIAPRAKGIVGDARTLPFRDGSFDTALDFGTLDNVGVPVEGYREACRVLASGGTLVSTYGNAAVLGPGDGISETYTLPAQVAEWLEANGVAVVGRSREEHARAVIIGRKR